jgi:cytochrome c oxidase subunit 2
MSDLGCLVCHSLDGSPGPGPTLKGVWGRRETVITDGIERIVTVDEAYLERSIQEPGADLVKGYRGIMPTEQLDRQELGILVRYLKGVK